MKRATPRRRFLLAAALWLAPTACGSLIPSGHQTTDAATIEAGNYRLDPDHTTVLFKVDHLGFSTYVGRFNTIAGTLDFNPASPADARLQVTIEIASVDTPSDDLDAVLRSESWFDAARSPTARFESRAIEPQGTDTGRVGGDLTLRGVTAPVALDVSFRGGADNLLTGRHTLGFEATGVLQRTVFGIGSLVPAIGDTVRLEIHAEFQRIDG